MNIEPLEAITNEQGFDPAFALQTAYIDPAKPEPPPEVVISIQGGRFGTLGNFSVIIGKAKSGKTYFNTLLLAGVSGAYMPMIEGNLRAAIFDTEQSRGDAQRVYLNRVVDLGGGLSNIKLFSIKAFSPNERQEIIAHYIENNPETELIIIDGIRDLLSDINNPEQSTELATWIMKLLDKYNVHIITVLHQNKNDNNARGHIGSELTNKAESVLSVSKNVDEVFTCHAEYTRAKAFDDISFRIDENGLPEIIADYKHQSDSAKKQGIAPEELNPQTHVELLKDYVFSKVDELKYSLLIDQIKFLLRKCSIKDTDSNAKKFRAFYLAEQMIIKKGTGAHSVYCLNDGYEIEKLPY